MKKKLLTLSPIIYSLALYQGATQCMENHIEKTITIITLDTNNQNTNTTISTYDFLNELRNHPKFINTDRPDYDQHIQKLHNAKTLNNTTQSTPAQEELNLEISQLMSGRIATTDEEEHTPTQAAETTGFGWFLRMKALTNTPTDLLLYALKSDMFEANNTDHRGLLNKAIVECVNEQKNNTLIDILLLAKEKHLGSIELDTDTSETAYNYLTTMQQTKNDQFVQRFAQLNTDKQIASKALITELQKQYTSTIAQTVEIMNNTNNEQKDFKNNFKASSNQNRKIMSALRKISNPALIIETNNQSWESLTQDIPNAVKNINLTTTALNNGKAAIENLSAHLLIEDKQ